MPAAFSQFRILEIAINESAPGIPRNEHNIPLIILMFTLSPSKLAANKTAKPAAARTKNLRNAEKMHSKRMRKADVIYIMCVVSMMMYLGCVRQKFLSYNLQSALPYEADNCILLRQI